MPVILSALFGFLGSAVTGLFNFKGEQAHTVQEAIKLLGDVNVTDAQSQVAAAQAISTILTQGSFIEKNWRPCFMIIILVIIVSFWFGYQPPHLNDPLSPMMDRLFTFLEIGMGGYIPLRTFEKIIDKINIASIIKTMISKRVL